eukprot:7738338-Alexandrium_andersonii.AAC.1
MLLDARAKSVGPNKNKTGLNAQLGLPDAALRPPALQKPSGGRLSCSFFHGSANRCRRSLLLL